MLISLHFAFWGLIFNFSAMRYSAISCPPILVFLPESILTDHPRSLQEIQWRGAPISSPQFLRLLTRYQFRLVAKKYKGYYRSKHFKCWDQLACMIFAHIRKESSLRDIDRALNSHSAKLYHIGIQQCPKSTLADANELRDYRI